MEVQRLFGLPDPALVEKDLSCERAWLWTDALFRTFVRYWVSLNLFNE